MTTPEQYDNDDYQVNGEDPGVFDSVKLFNDRVKIIRATWLQEAKVIGMKIQKKVQRGKTEKIEDYDFELSDSETVVAVADPLDTTKITISQKFLTDFSDKKELAVTVTAGAAITALATFGYLKSKQKNEPTSTKK